MDNQSSITYADDWKSADNPEYYQPVIHEDEDIEPDIKRKKSGSKPLLILIQIIVCALIVAAAYGVKCVGGDLYKNIRKAYYDALKDEIILTENFESFNLDTLFNAPDN